jgi:predicted transcriptional regulator
MTAGVAVIAAPAVLIGVGAYAWAAQRNKKLLIEKKEMLLQEVLKKHNTIISELNKTAEGNKDRINYLTRLNTLLQAAIQDLKSDLAIKYE